MSSVRTFLFTLVGCVVLAPVARAQVVLTQPTILLSSQPNPYAGQDVIVDGTTLTLQAGQEYHFRSLIIRNEGALLGTDIQVLTDLGLEVNDLSRIVATGFGPGEGPGAGRYTFGVTHAGGGGHGGKGGDSSLPIGLGGNPYGDSLAPRTWGSGGGCNLSASPRTGGAGGGSIRLRNLSGVVRIDSAVVARGENGSGSDAGGGAGGSIWITSPSIVGVGAIVASGGQACCAYAGGGGGGRVLLESCDSGAPSAPFVSVQGGGNVVGSPGQGGSVVRAPLPSPQLLAESDVVLAADNQHIPLVVTESTGMLTVYRWSKDNVPLSDGGPYTGTHTPVLVISSAHAQQSGTYRLLASPFCGSNSFVDIYVEIAPTFIVQPTSARVANGHFAVFGVSAYSLSAASYRWRCNAVPIGDGPLFGSTTIATGTDTAILTLTNVSPDQDLFVFDCQVSNFAGRTLSRGAALGVGAPPSIACNLADVTGVGGPPEGIDGILTVDDLIAFVNAFIEGCGG